MAYKKNVWKSKDRITKEKLNNMEEGIYEAHQNITMNSDLSLYQLKDDKTLLTSEKNIVGAINELFQNVSNGKTLIASAIADKGVITSNVSTFQQLANNIRLIQTTSFNNVIVMIDGKKYKLTEDSNGNITANLINFSINNILTNCTNNNSNASIAYGGTYTAKITAKTNYELSNVTVKMGGVDITSSAYSNGNISITSVTGDIEITATATAVTVINTYTVTKTLNHCTINNTASQVTEGGSYTANITADTGYELSNVTVKMGDTDITSTAYNSSTHSITISNITGNVEINASAISTSKACTSVTLDETSITFNDDNSKILVATITPTDCTDSIRWYSDDENIATVENGVVTPKNNGSCLIKVICGSQIASCNVTVNIVVSEENMTASERVMDLMYPMPQNHACVPSNAPDDWAKESIMYNKKKPSGWTGLDAQFQIYRKNESGFATNAAVEIGRLYAYGWRNGQWNSVTQLTFPSISFYAEDYTDNVKNSFTESVRTTTSSTIIKLTSNMVISTSGGVKNVYCKGSTGVVSYYNDYEYVFIAVKMRKVKWNETGLDDLETGKYCANCTGEWYETTGLYGDSVEIGQPKFTEITTNWKLFALTTVPENWNNGFPEI